MVVEAVAGRLDELTQVERRVAHWQVTRQRPTLQYHTVHTQEVSEKVYL